MPASVDDLALTDLVDLGVQFSKPAGTTARGAVLVVTYVSGGDTFVLRSDFELVLCEGDAREPQWAQECADWWDIGRYREASRAAGPGR